MKVYVVLYEKFGERDFDVLDVYADEEKANSRVGYERSLIEANPNERFRDDCWYQEREVI
jgi:hypothetical protein